MCAGNETKNNNAVFSDPEAMAARDKLVETEIKKVIKTHEVKILGGVNF